MAEAAKVEVRPPDVPGYTHKVDAAEYRAMRAELLKAVGDARDD